MVQAFQKWGVDLSGFPFPSSPTRFFDIKEGKESIQIFEGLILQKRIGFCGISIQKIWVLSRALSRGKYCQHVATYVSFALQCVQGLDSL